MGGGGEGIFAGKGLKMKTRSRGAFMRWFTAVNSPAPWPPGFGDNRGPAAPPEQFVFEFVRPLQMAFAFLGDSAKLSKPAWDGTGLPPGMSR